jgi:hypothetical protein
MFHVWEFLLWKPSTQFCSDHKFYLIILHSCWANSLVPKASSLYWTYTTHLWAWDFSGLLQRITEFHLSSVNLRILPLLFVFKFSFSWYQENWNFFGGLDGSCHHAAVPWWYPILGAQVRGGQMENSLHAFASLNSDSFPQSNTFV